MKGTLSLVISILVTALAVGVPAAFADPGLNGAPEMSSTPTPDWFERAAAAAEQGAVAPYVDAFERPGVALQTSAPDWFERAAAADARDISAAPYVDAFERAAAADARDISAGPYVDAFERAAAADARDISAAPYVDAFERPAPVTTQTASSLDSGTDIAWGQIGLAFGLGLLLALGLSMAITLPRRAATVGHEN